MNNIYVILKKTLLATLFCSLAFVTSAHAWKFKNAQNRKLISKVGQLARNNDSIRQQLVDAMEIGLTARDASLALEKDHNFDAFKQKMVGLPEQMVNFFVLLSLADSVVDEAFEQSPIIDMDVYANEGRDPWVRVLANIAEEQKQIEQIRQTLADEKKAAELTNEIRAIRDAIVSHGGALKSPVGKHYADKKMPRDEMIAHVNALFDLEV